MQILSLAQEKLIRTLMQCLSLKVHVYLFFVKDASLYFTNYGHHHEPEAHQDRAQGQALRLMYMTGLAYL